MVGDGIRAYMAAHDLTPCPNDPITVPDPSAVTRAFHTIGHRSFVRVSARAAGYFFSRQCSFGQQGFSSQRTINNVNINIALSATFVGLGQRRSAACGS